MNYSIIIRPLIGALIGYVTNWLAIKMMFKPLKPIKIGKFTLPFTPGIIPKNQSRLAESIADAISNNLLTEEDLKNNLLSAEIKEKLNNYLLSSFYKIEESETNIKDISIELIKEEKYNNITYNIKNYLSSSIFDTVEKANLGKIIANQIEIVAKEKVKGSILNLIGANSIINSISKDIEITLNDYIKSNGELIIKDMVSKEIEKYTETPLSTIASQISIDKNELIFSFENIYEKFISNKLPDILETINISKIIKNKINEMDIKELENIIIKIMKKELNSLVNLGAFIGLILGMLNLVF